MSVKTTSLADRLYEQRLREQAEERRRFREATEAANRNLTILQTTVREYELSVDHLRRKYGNVISQVTPILNQLANEARFASDSSELYRINSRIEREISSIKTKHREIPALTTKLEKEDREKRALLASLISQVDYSLKSFKENAKQYETIMKQSIPPRPYFNEFEDARIRAKNVRFDNLDSLIKKLKAISGQISEDTRSYFAPLKDIRKILDRQKEELANLEKRQKLEAVTHEFTLPKEVTKLLSDLDKLDKYVFEVKEDIEVYLQTRYFAFDAEMVEANILHILVNEQYSPLEKMGEIERVYEGFQEKIKYCKVSLGDYIVLKKEFDEYLDEYAELVVEMDILEIPFDITALKIKDSIEQIKEEIEKLRKQQSRENIQKQLAALLEEHGYPKLEEFSEGDQEVMIFDNKNNPDTVIDATISENNQVVLRVKGIDGPRRVSKEYVYEAAEGFCDAFVELLEGLDEKGIANENTMMFPASLEHTSYVTLKNRPPKQAVKKAKRRKAEVKAQYMRGEYK